MCPPCPPWWPARARPRSPRPCRRHSSRPAPTRRAPRRPRRGHATSCATGTPPSRSSPGPQVLIDGTQLFAAQKTLQELSALGSGTTATSASVTGSARVEILYNPELKTSYIMIPGLAGVILVFVGTVITSLGVVRERQAGTLEQLAVMPLRPTD